MPAGLKRAAAVGRAEPRHRAGHRPRRRLRRWRLRRRRELLRVVRMRAREGARVLHGRGRLPAPFAPPRGLPPRQLRILLGTDAGVVPLRRVAMARSGVPAPEHHRVGGAGQDGGALHAVHQQRRHARRAAMPGAGPGPQLHHALRLHSATPRVQNWCSGRFQGASSPGRARARRGRLRTYAAARGVLEPRALRVRHAGGDLGNRP